jgi:hypothetical protein
LRLTENIDIGLQIFACTAGYVAAKRFATKSAVSKFAQFF